MDIKGYISSGIIESYVLGLASEEEVSILNCIRKNNVEVEQAIAEAEKTLEELADIQAMAMPVSLKEDIWNKLNAENLVASSDPAEGNETESSTIDYNIEQNSGEKSEAVIVPRKSYNWAIAASVLLVLSVGANVLLYQQNNETKDKLTKTSASFDQQQASLATLQDKWRLVQNPEIKTIPLKGVENKPDLHALVFWDQLSKAVYLNLEQMPTAPKGKQYQLWAMVDGKPVNAGVFPLDAKVDGTSKMLDIPKAQAFAITLEDEGGKDVPTLSELYVMGGI
ncbi:MULTISPECIES: anti-sigma factor domain-containing protein [Sphingobacterium]|uniref:Anti-sigma-K factor rskA n=1 Tax=Sphingobacterium detergens TaxID=1145106 RepID=A0A420BKZ9_SPHD1|nr:MULTISPECIES: anti-sigma factor [Sphingobacterium]MCS4227063.1 anti-sigma-K factor RskA [Sphingobacterium sp. BIGb0165]RKE57342.1 anti-sigma-K factor rskA [Sphingobacterium detergens]